jgi:hypothetical protein
LPHVGRWSLVGREYSVEDNIPHRKLDFHMPDAQIRAGAVVPVGPAFTPHVVADAN